jgi:ribosome-binding protein aMBF1 (putative translation factor)
MPTKNNQPAIRSWEEIKDAVYGPTGTLRRDKLDQEFQSLKVGLLIKRAREERNLTQEQLAQKINKKRSYISRVENDGSNLTLKTLLQIVETGLGGKVQIDVAFEENLAP